jgi:hypothetical protein
MQADEIGRIMVPGQFQQKKNLQNPFQKKNLVMVVYTC